MFCYTKKWHGRFKENHKAQSIIISLTYYLFVANQGVKKGIPVKSKLDDTQCQTLTFEHEDQFTVPLFISKTISTVISGPCMNAD